jgi:hypothetical protein
MFMINEINANIYINISEMKKQNIDNPIIINIMLIIGDSLYLSLYLEFFKTGLCLINPGTLYGSNSAVR